MAREQVLLQVLATQGMAVPDLPPRPVVVSRHSSASGTGNKDAHHISSTVSSVSAAAAAAYAPLLQRMGSSGAAAASQVVSSYEALVGSPSSSHVSEGHEAPAAADNLQSRGQFCYVWCMCLAVGKVVMS